jgi:hypothetical protein
VRQRLTAELVMRARTRVAVVLLSDGLPLANAYAKGEGVAHVAAEVHRLVACGYGFVALHLGDEVDHHVLERMYGRRWLRLRHSQDIPAALARVCLDYLDR